MARARYVIRNKETGLYYGHSTDDWFEPTSTLEDAYIYDEISEPCVLLNTEEIIPVTLTITLNK